MVAFRIALVYRAFHREGSLARTAVELARHLSSNHEVHVFSIPERTDPSLAPGCTFHAVPAPPLGDGRHFSGRELISFARNAARLLERHPFDVVHTCAPSTWVGDLLHIPGIARGEAALQGLPAWRFRATLRHPGNLARLVIERRAVGNGAFSRFHVAAPSVRDDLERFYAVPADRVTVVYPGVDLEQFQPVTNRAAARAEVGVDDPTRLVLLFCGSDFHRKGLDRAIDCLAAAAVPAELLVVGSDPSQARFEHLARARGVGDRVRFLGSRSDSWRYFRAADVALLPTRADVWGVTPIEAMGCGVPSIVSAAAGSAAAVEEAGAGIVLPEPFDVRSLRDAVERFAGDPSLRHAMGSAGIEAARRYSWATRARLVEEELVAIAETVVGRRSPDRHHTTPAVDTPGGRS